MDSLIENSVPVMMATSGSAALSLLWEAIGQ